MLWIVGGNSLLRMLEQCEGPMRARTSIGSSPTGRCSGLDKVPWRDLTLLDKLDIQALGLHHPSRGSAPTIFWFFDATINRRLASPLLFSFSSHCRAFFGARGNMNGGRRKGRDHSWNSKYVYVDSKGVQDHLRSGISRICIMWKCPGVP